MKKCPLCDKMHDSQTAIMTKFIVIDRQGNQVGFGYVIWKDGTMREPTLFDNEGNRLPEQWYTLVAVEQELVIAPERIQ